MQLLPSVPHGWLIQEVTDDIISTAKKCGFKMVCPRANALTTAGVQQLVDEGFVVRAWGVKSIEVRRWIMHLGMYSSGVDRSSRYQLRQAAVAGVKECIQQSKQLL